MRCIYYTTPPTPLQPPKPHNCKRNKSDCPLARTAAFVFRKELCLSPACKQGGNDFNCGENVMCGRMRDFCCRFTISLHLAVHHNRFRQYEHEQHPVHRIRKSCHRRCDPCTLPSLLLQLQRLQEWQILPFPPSS